MAELSKSGDGLEISYQYSLQSNHFHAAILDENYDSKPFGRSNINRRIIVMKQLSTITIGVVLLVTGLGLATNVLADEPGYGHGWGHHGDEMGKMHHEGGYQHHEDGCKKDKSWKQDLSDSQRKEIDKLKLAYKQKKYLLKSQLKQANVEFALLITNDSPDQSAINKKIDAIAKLKADKLRLKADHKISVRKVLTPEQRVKFDMAVLEKAYSGKKKGHKR
jgi:Spy/CpxP family protein refolding chaperone